MYGGVVYRGSKDMDITDMYLRRFQVFLQYLHDSLVLTLSHPQIVLPEPRPIALKARRSPLQLPDNVVQSLHEVCAVGIRPNSAEILTYVFVHRVEIGMPEGVPDEEQVGLEDLDVPEFSDQPYYTPMISQAASRRRVAEEVVVSTTTRRCHGYLTVAIRSMRSVLVCRQRSKQLLSPWELRTLFPPVLERGPRNPIAPVRIAGSRSFSSSRLRPRP